MASTTAAIIIQPFDSWRSLTDRSPNIIIARCTATPDPLSGKKNEVLLDIQDGVIDSEIVVIHALKGRTNLGPSRLVSQYWPRQGENYLIFSDYETGAYNAIETYRILPLGTVFLTNSLVGSSLDEQIRNLLQRRLRNLNREIEDRLKEKTRLETFF